MSGELAQSGDEHDDQSSGNSSNVPSHDPAHDPYYTEIIWFGQQSEDGGLTQAEIDELAWLTQHNREIDEQLALNIGQKMLEFALWLKEHDRINEWPVGYVPNEQLLAQLLGETPEQRAGVKKVGGSWIPPRPQKGV